MMRTYVDSRPAYRPSRECEEEEESREEVDERRSSDDSSERHGGEVQATRLFDKLDQLEKRWQSQKTQQRRYNHHFVQVQAPSLGRDLPEVIPQLSPTFSTVCTFDSDQRPISRSGSFADQRQIGASSSFTDQRHLARCDSFISTGSAKSEQPKKNRRKKAPRIVSMFDRLYQKGKGKTIERGRFVLPQSKPKINRNKRRQLAAAAIQGVFRGRKLRKKLQRLSQTALVIQKWWRDIMLRLRFLQLRSAILILQSLQRKRKALREFRHRLKAVVVIQSQQRVRSAKIKRCQLVKEREKSILESDASVLIQGLMMKDLKVLRQHHVECRSLMVEETPSDELEREDCDERSNVERTPSDEINRHGQRLEKSQESISLDQCAGLVVPRGSKPPSLELTLAQAKQNGAPCEEATAVVTDDITLSCIQQRPPALSGRDLHFPPPSPQSSSSALYRAAQIRRRALKQTPSDPIHTSRARSSSRTRRNGMGRRDATPDRVRSCSKYSSIVYDYLPTKKTYWAYDAQKAAKILVLQRWAKLQIENRRRRRASVSIQCAWRTYRAHFHLISGCLLKQWSVRVDFHQEETTSNPILRQKVRLLALTNAIRQVNDECILQEVMRTSYSFVVSWKTEASIYFGEDQVMAELNRCSIHVTCEAHRHPLWESWSRPKKFTLLSKAALMRSFANQCARLSRASVLMQSLKMRRILLNMAREKEAALVIQSFWKRYGQEIKEMKHLQIARYAAVRLQSWWRMTMCIYLLEIQDMSACSIQALLRGHLTRRNYAVAQQQIVMLQSKMRGLHQRTILRLQRDGVIRIQKAVRGYMVRLKKHKEIYAALAIQDWYRAISLKICMSKIRLSYSILQCLVQRQAILQRLQEEQLALRIQSWWRMSTCKAIFFNDVHRIIAIQALYRGCEVRMTLKLYKVSSTKIQAIVRGRQARLQLSVGLLAVRSLQAWWRKTNLCNRFARLRSLAMALQRIHWGNKARAAHEELHNAAVRIQKVWRMSSALEVYSAKYLSILDIQRIYRGFVARETYKATLAAHKAAAALQLQSWWRMSRAVELYSTKYLSILDIQRVYNGFKARERYKAMWKKREMHIASVQIQSMHRGYTARVAFQLQLASSVVVQRVYRGYKTCKDYQLQLASAVGIQRVYRGYKAWKEYQLLLALSLDIQKLYRGYNARKEYQILLELRMFAASFQVQTWWRMIFVCRSYAKQQLGALKIQRLYRGFKCRDKINQARMDRAATLLQAIWRMSQKGTSYARLLHSSVVLQKVYRGFVARRRFSAIVKSNHAAAVIQLAWDDYRERKATNLYNAIVLVQKRYRGHQVRKQIHPLEAFLTSRGTVCRYLNCRHFSAHRQMQLSALRIQSWWRTALCKQQLATKRVLLRQTNAATQLQSWYRTRQAVNDFEEILVASIIIQALYRGFFVRLQAAEHKSASKTIQSWFRKLVAKKRMSAAVEIQSLMQRLMRKNSANVSVSAAVVIQRWRRNIVKKRLRAAMLIQSWRRVMVAKRRIQAAAMIQSWHKQVAKKRKQIAAVVRIQAFWRRSLCILAFGKVRQHLISLQAIYRGFSARHQNQMQVEAVKAIQFWYQGRKAELFRQRFRRQYTLLSDSSVSMHDFGDEHSAVDVVKEYQLCSILTFPADKTEASATLVQAMYRTYVCKQSYSKARSAVIRIQNSWRVYSKRNICTRAVVHEEGIEVERMVRPNQVVWLKKLRTLAGILVQSWWRARTHRRKYLIVQKERMQQRGQEGLMGCSKSSTLGNTLYSTLGATSEIAEATTHKSLKVKLAQPFWLFNPLSLPLSLTSCLDTVQSVEMLGKNNKAAHTAAKKIQRWWLTQKAMMKSKEMQEGDMVEEPITNPEKIDDKSAVSKPTTRSQVHKQLVLIISSACKLQVWWRKTLVRMIQERWSRATKIQSIVRRAQACAFVLRVRSATNIQCWYRALSTGSKYHRMRKGFASLQQEWLRYSCSPDFKARIEKRTRGILALQQRAKEHFQEKTASAIKLQRQWRLRRGVVSLQRIVKRRFWMKTKAAFILQQYWYRFQAKSSFVQSKAMAICVQSQWRKFKARKAFKKQRVGFVQFQLLWQQTLQRKTNAAVRVQRDWRMSSTMVVCHQKWCAATLISKTWRRRSSHSKYQKMYAALVIVQALGRGRFLKKSNCAVLLQRSWHKHSQRRKTAAATLIQKTWRMQRVRHSFRRNIIACVCIQRFQRGSVCQLSYSKMRKGFLNLQKRAQQRVHLKTKAVILLQQYQRMNAASTKHAIQRKAAIQLQAQWRWFSAWSKYITMYCGICSMQELVKRSFIKKTASVITLQSHTRTYFARTIYKLQKLGAILVQRQWRGKTCRKRFNTQMSGFLAFQFIAKQLHQKKTKSAIIIQAFQRKTTARFTFKQKQMAAIVLQSRYRGTKCKSAYSIMRPGFVSLQVLAKLWFRIKNTCAVQIQAATRRMLCRKRYQMQLLAAVKVQSAFRGFVHRRNLAVLRWLHSIASTMIASWWRRVSNEFKYQHFRCATIALQTGFRRRRQERAATRLQSWWRCCTAAAKFQRARSAVIKLELKIRMFLASCRGQHAAASVIQKSWVASQQRFLVRCLLVLGRAKAAIALQRWWRGILLVRRYKRMLHEAKRRKLEAARRQRHKKRACDPLSMLCNVDFASLTTNMMPWGLGTTIVAAPERRTSSRRSHHHHSPSHQRHHHHQQEHHQQCQQQQRQQQQQRDARTKLRAAIKIQQQWRDFQRSRAKEYYKKSISAAWIQCVWRGHSARRRYKLMIGNKAAESLQVAWQDIQKRRVETKQIMKIQAQWRMRREQWKYEDLQIERQVGCIMIQSAWRMHCSREPFLRLRNSAVKIQDVARKLMKHNAAARKIQRMWWISKLRGTINGRKSRCRTSLPAMVLHAVLDFALKGTGGN